VDALSVEVEKKRSRDLMTPFELDVTCDDSVEKARGFVAEQVGKRGKPLTV